MKFELLSSAMLLFAATSLVLPLLTVIAVKLLEKRIRYGACYLILLLCVIRILFPTGWGLPTLVSVSPISEWRTGETVEWKSETDDGVFISPSVTVPTVGTEQGTGSSEDLPQAPSEPFLEKAGAFLVNHLTELLLLLWGIGALALLTITVLPQLNGMRRERRASLPVSEEILAVYRSVCRERGGRSFPDIRCLEAPVSPHLNGVVRPVIYLGSTTLEEQELAGVLRHELTHYRRGDLLVKWLLTLNLAVFWWNPAVWYLVRYAQSLMELSCDERTLLQASEEERLSYGNAILKTLKACKRAETGLTVGWFGNRSHAVLRFREILSVKPRRRGRGAVLILSVVLVLSALVFGISAYAEDEQPLTDVFLIQGDCDLTHRQLCRIADTLETPTQEGMRMVGWRVYADTASGGDYSIRFEAMFEPRQYRIRLEANGGSVTGAREKYAYGSVLPVPVRGKDTFGGWYSDVGLRTPVTTVPAEHCTLYARWLEETPTNAFTFSQGTDGLILRSYTGSDIAVRIPAYVGGQAVTAVAVNCFSFHTSLQKVILPDSVYRIGAGAFRYCYSLEEVTLGEHLESIDQSVFDACYRLKRIRFGGDEVRWREIVPREYPHVEVVFGA